VHYHYFIFFENKRKTNLETDDGTCPKRQLFNKTNNTGITENADKGVKPPLQLKAMGWVTLFIIL